MPKAKTRSRAGAAKKGKNPLSRSKSKQTETSDDIEDSTTSELPTSPESARGSKKDGPTPTVPKSRPPQKATKRMGDEKEKWEDLPDLIDPENPNKKYTFITQSKAHREFESKGNKLFKKLTVNTVPGTIILI